MGNELQTRAASHADVGRLAEILIAATESAFAGRVPPSCLTDLSVAESAANWRRFLQSEPYLTHQERLIVAEHAAEAVGFVLAGKRSADVIKDPAIAEAYPREITSLQVAPEWQRRGVGRMLIAAVAPNLTARVCVRVLEPNPNRAFYTRLGAELLASQAYDWAGFATRELIYGWQDINTTGRSSCPDR